jgi:hypothetical protein
VPKNRHVEPPLALLGRLKVFDCGLAAFIDARVRWAALGDVPKTYKLENRYSTSYLVKALLALSQAV